MGVNRPNVVFSGRDLQMPVDMETYEQEALAELVPPVRSADSQALAELRAEVRAQSAEASRVYRGFAFFAGLALIIAPATTP
jgi:hypothetical protein